MSKTDLDLADLSGHLLPGGKSGVVVMALFVFAVFTAAAVFGCSCGCRCGCTLFCGFARIVRQSLLSVLASVLFQMAWWRCWLSFPGAPSCCLRLPAFPAISFRAVPSRRLSSRTRPVASHCCRASSTFPLSLPFVCSCCLFLVCMPPVFSCYLSCYLLLLSRPLAFSSRPDSVSLSVVFPACPSSYLFMVVLSCCRFLLSFPVTFSFGLSRPFTVVFPCCLFRLSVCAPFPCCLFRGPFRLSLPGVFRCFLICGLLWPPIFASPWSLRSLQWLPLVERLCSLSRLSS